MDSMIYVAFGVGAIFGTLVTGAFSWWLFERFYLRRLDRARTALRLMRETLEVYKRFLNKFPAIASVFLEFAKETPRYWLEVDQVRGPGEPR